MALFSYLGNLSSSSTFLKERLLFLPTRAELKLLAFIRILLLCRVTVSIVRMLSCFSESSRRQAFYAWVKEDAASLTTPIAGNMLCYVG